MDRASHLRLERQGLAPLPPRAGEDVSCEHCERTITNALQPVGRLRLTDSKGDPLCAAVRPALVEWSAEPLDDQPAVAGMNARRRHSRAGT